MISYIEEHYAEDLSLDELAAQDVYKRQQVEITNGEILRTQEALATAQADEAKQYEDMKTRIKYMYETGNATLLEMLFSAETMTDFLNKADFIQNISSYDREMLEELQACLLYTSCPENSRLCFF